MSTHDPRRGSEVAELAQLLPAPAERDLPNGRRHLLKEHLMTEFRNDQAGRQAAGPTGPGGPGGPRRPRRLWLTGPAGLATAAGAAVLAAAVAGGSVWALGGGAPGPAGAAPGAHLTAARLLAKVADAAARAKPTDVTDGQFAYVASKIAYGRTDGPAPAKIHDRQVWMPAADLCQGVMESEDRQQADSYPERGPNGKCPNPGAMAGPTYRLLQSLPTEPHALLRLIHRTVDGAGQSPDQEAFTTIGDLLGESIAPPDVSAALYKAAALIPGVKVVPGVTDAIGRPGIAVSFSFRGAQNEWIFDQRTFQFLGERDLVHGRVDYTSAIITRAFVDHAGELPSGR
jgi:hypothetical protein